MSALNTKNVNAILNQVAVEVGLTPAADPFGSTEEHFTQMRYLLQTAGEELLLAYPWATAHRSHTITTDGSGEYGYPDDYLYMVNQTGWVAGENAPLSGPLSAQEWVYLSNNIAGESRIHFRFQDENILLLGDDTVGDTITFEYITRNWVYDSSTTPVAYMDEVLKGNNVPLFDRTLFTRYVKTKWLDAKGFDSSKAQDDFNQMFSFLTSKDKGARVLNAGGYNRGIRLLDMNNIPDTGYGL